MISHCTTQHNITNSHITTTNQQSTTAAQISYYIFLIFNRLATATQGVAVGTYIQYGTVFGISHTKCTQQQRQQKGPLSFGILSPTTNQPPTATATTEKGTPLIKQAQSLSETPCAASLVHLIIMLAWLCFSFLGQPTNQLPRVASQLVELPALT